jgi:hypothetical protein
VPVELRLLEDRNAVAYHLEAPAGRRKQGDLSVGVLGTNLGRQTGSPRFVASDGAVFDRYAHGTRENNGIKRFAAKASKNPAGKSSAGENRRPGGASFPPLRAFPASPSAYRRGGGQGTFVSVASRLIRVS